MYFEIQFTNDKFAFTSKIIYPKGENTNDEKETPLKIL